MKIQKWRYISTLTTASCTKVGDVFDCNFYRPHTSVDQQCSVLRNYIKTSNCPNRNDGTVCYPKEKSHAKKQSGINEH